MDRDEFYVGYHDDAPAGFARRTRWVVGVVAAAAACVATAGALLQGPFAAKTFEFGVEREFVGWARLEPVPRLVVAAPGGDPGASTLLSFPLTRAGTKFGARDLIGAHDGSFVRLRGWLLYRDGTAMIDVVPGTVHGAGAGPTLPEEPVVELGDHTLVGQIVDSKCYFGVMNPDTGTVHRACAVRCISSGTPPVLVVRDGDGRERHLLLVGRDGRSIHREILDVVAEPVEVTGAVSRIGALTVLRADPEDIRRLPRVAGRAPDR